MALGDGPVDLDDSLLRVRALVRNAQQQVWCREYVATYYTTVLVHNMDFFLTVIATAFCNEKMGSLCLSPLFCCCYCWHGEQIAHRSL